MRTTCADHAKSGESGMSTKLEAMFFGPSPSQVLYNLEGVYALLMPAVNPISEEAFEFQVCGYTILRQLILNIQGKTAKCGERATSVSSKNCL